jgi:hypothetical protein
MLVKKMGIALACIMMVAGAINLNPALISIYQDNIPAYAEPICC